MIFREKMKIISRLIFASLLFLSISTLITNVSAEESKGSFTITAEAVKEAGNQSIGEIKTQNNDPLINLVKSIIESIKKLLKNL